MKKFKNGDKVCIAPRYWLVESEKYIGMEFTVVGEMFDIGDNENVVFIKELNKPYLCSEFKHVKPKEKTN